MTPHYYNIDTGSEYNNVFLGATFTDWKYTHETID